MLRVSYVRGTLAPSIRLARPLDLGRRALSGIRQRPKKKKKGPPMTKKERRKDLLSGMVGRFAQRMGGEKMEFAKFVRSRSVANVKRHETEVERARMKMKFTKEQFDKKLMMTVSTKATKVSPKPKTMIQTLEMTTPKSAEIDELEQQTLDPSVKMFRSLLDLNRARGKIHRMMKEAPSSVFLWPDRFRQGFDKSMLDKLNADKDESSFLKSIYGFQNASQSEIGRQVIKQMIQVFQRKNADTGSSEVQIAVITTRIHMLKNHMLKHHKDVSSRRGLEILIHRRRKLLHYLKRTDHRRYVFCIRLLGLKDNPLLGWR